MSSLYSPLLKYLLMLKENIVKHTTSSYVHSIISTGECKAKVTESQLPYLEGDYWPGPVKVFFNNVFKKKIIENNEPSEKE